MNLPVIDVSALRQGGEGAKSVASQIDSACRKHGFFLITGLSPVHSGVHVLSIFRDCAGIRRSASNVGD
jgi:isopenicillin N synthase-like dioxygenase